MEAFLPFLLLLLFNISFLFNGLYGEEGQIIRTTGCECGDIVTGKRNKSKSKPIKFGGNPMEKMMQAKKVRNRKARTRGVQRIVNGYEPERRPFMALIEMHKEIPVEGKTPTSNPQCGGALVNKRWVITAAHCFCMKPLGCVYQASEDNKTRQGGKPDFDMRQVTVYLGLHDISGKSRHKQDIYKPERIVIYPKYVRDERDQNDIALVRLEKDVRFNKRTSPICFPPNVKYKDAGLEEVYVSGWGLLSDAKCTTDSGPSLNQRCKFPFTWQDQEYEGCAHTSTPSEANPECESFKKKRGWNRMKVNTNYTGVQLRLEGGNSSTCYEESPRRYGWCATCEAKKCKESKGAAAFDHGWGWCTKFCRGKKGQRRTSILQEAKMSTLTPEQCAFFGQDMKAVPTIELCAAVKQSPEQFETFVKRGDEYLKQQPNATGAFHLGGSDSCKGDSGGPLFTLGEDGKAILIGVVSRGKGCAAHNQAGIYTRVKKKLRWIFRYITDANCG